MRTFLQVATSILLMQTLNAAVQPMGSNLEGTWTCVSAVVNGKHLPAETTEVLRLTLTKDRYKTEKAGQVLFDNHYQLDTSKQPARIDIIGTEGELKGKPALGIFALEGDTLRICYTMPGKMRPAEFKSDSGSEAYLIVWRRNKK